MIYYESAKTKNPARWSKLTRDWSVVERVDLNPRKNKENLAA